MKCVLIVVVMVYLDLMLQCQAFIIRDIMVNKPLTLPCTCPGNCPEVQWIRFIPMKSVIADIWMCDRIRHYQNRSTVSGDTSRGNYSLTISSVVYNDAGSYRCICNGESVSEVKVNVFVPTVIKALEGENVTLPCYGHTLQGVKDVRWRKDGLKVLLYTHANRSVTTDEASESRFMMSVEGFLDGDLSLHISSLHLSDAGLYQCFIHDESQDGEPRGVLLKVEGQQQITPTNSSKVLVLPVLLIISGGVIIGLIIWIVWRRRRSRNKGRNTEIPALPLVWGQEPCSRTLQSCLVGQRD